MEHELATDYDRMLDELQQEIVEREEELYSEVVLREAVVLATWARSLKRT